MKGKPDLPLRLLVVWEPVLDTDRTAGLLISGRRALLPDPRATHYWDPERHLAGVLRERAPKEMTKDPQFIVWDMVAVYPKGVRWPKTGSPEPAFAGNPVVRSMEGLKKALGLVPPEAGGN